MNREIEPRGHAQLVLQYHRERAEKTPSKHGGQVRGRNCSSIITLDGKTASDVTSEASQVEPVRRRDIAPACQMAAR